MHLNNDQNHSLMMMTAPVLWKNMGLPNASLYETLHSDSRHWMSLVLHLNYARSNSLVMKKDQQVLKDMELPSASVVERTVVVVVVVMEEGAAVLELKVAVLGHFPLSLETLYWISLVT